MSQPLSRGFVVAGMAVSILAMYPAQAHNAGVSTSRVAIHGRTIDVEINALGRDYETAVGVRIADKGSGEVNPVALAVMAPSILSYVDRPRRRSSRKSAMYVATGNGKGGRHPRFGSDGVELSA